MLMKYYLFIFLNSPAPQLGSPSEMELEREQWEALSFIIKQVYKIT